MEKEQMFVVHKYKYFGGRLLSDSDQDEYETSDKKRENFTAFSQ